MIWSTRKPSGKRLNEEQLNGLPILTQFQQYLETRVRLAKYQAIQKGTAVAAVLIAEFTMALFLLLALLFASITVAYFLGGLFNSVWAGFGCVTLFYLLATVGIKLFKNGLERSLINLLIIRVLKKDDSDQKRK